VLIIRGAVFGRRLKEYHLSTTTRIDHSNYFAIPSPGPKLGSDEVQVWLANQDQRATQIKAFFQTLSPDEQQRAQRFHFKRDRERFIAARGILRRCLGAFLEMTADRVRFRYTEYGKPSLSAEFSSTGLKFNISHSGSSVLLGFSIGRELGVDIEEIRPDFATAEIAKRYFSALEVQTLKSLPTSVQAEAFFNCWTRKEAYIKAMGEGLSCALDKFDVTLVPGEPARLLETRGHGLRASGWAMRSLDVGRAYKAALVVEGHEWGLKCYTGPSGARSK
jgi:4'-phosphopantetheinyl transferase